MSPNIDPKIVDAASKANPGIKEAVRENAKQFSTLLDKVDSQELGGLFKNEWEGVLKGINSADLQKLVDQTHTYKDFIEKRTESLSLRNKLLNSRIEGVNVWGGKEMRVEGENITDEQGAERLYWSREIVGALCQKQITLAEAQQIMRDRLIQLQQEAAARGEQVEKFLAIRKQVAESGGALNHPHLSIKRFNEASFEERSTILLKLGDQGEVERFKADMKALQTKIETAPPEEGWLACHFALKKYSPLKDNPAYSEWVSFIKQKRDEIGLKIKTYTNGLLQEITPALKGEKPIGEERDRFLQYYQYLSKLPAELKLNGKLGANIVESELKLLALLQEESAEDTEIIANPQDALLKEQMDTEFIRRIHLQLVALTMSYGQTEETAHKAQQELTDQQDRDLMGKDTFGEIQDRYLEGAAAEETGISQEELSADVGTSLDVASAVEESDLEVESSDSGQAKVTPSEESQERHQVSYWEMERISGYKPWDPNDLENYLKAIRRSGNRLSLTYNYKIVKFRRAREVMLGWLVSNLDKLPGHSYEARNACFNKMRENIKNARNRGGDFIDKVFSHTEAQVGA